MALSAPLLRSRRWFWPLMAAFLIICYMWRLGVLRYVPADQSFQRFFALTQLPGMLDEFVIGIVVARWLIDRKQGNEQAQGWQRLAWIVGTVVVLGSALALVLRHVGDFWSVPFMVIGWRSLLAAGFGMLLVAFLQSGPLLTRVIQRTGLSYIGLISYSIYLVHIPVILSVKNVKAPDTFTANHYSLFTLVCLISTLLIATASYYFVEARWIKAA